MKNIGQLGEFSIIDLITAKLSVGPELCVGPGDDGAVLALPDTRVVASTDFLLEDRHFRRSWSSAFQIGRKAAARNLADIAAMGARPLALLLGLGLPSDLDLNWVLRFIEGFNHEAVSAGASVAGGDICRADTIVIAPTSLGTLDGRDPVRRGGARSGDKVVVAGRLGWAEAGLALLRDGRDFPEELLDAHRFPQPPYSAGPSLSIAGATAMCDVSDGLMQDLGHIASASGVRIDLESSALDVHPVLAGAADLLGMDVRKWVLTGGDDYALAATLSTNCELPKGCVEVGAVSSGSGVFVDGAVPFERLGHQHFS